MALLELSRGTQEQVNLALRLAVVKANTRSRVRGCCLSYWMIPSSNSEPHRYPPRSLRCATLQSTAVAAWLARQRRAGVCRGRSRVQLSLSRREWTV